MFNLILLFQAKNVIFLRFFKKFNSENSNQRFNDILNIFRKNLCWVSLANIKKTKVQYFVKKLKFDYFFINVYSIKKFDWILSKT